MYLIDNMSEIKSIEYYTAEAFLKLYNSIYGTYYKVVEISEAPDVICEDETGNKLKLEITISEDRNGDIQAMLGRSNSRDIDVMKAQGFTASCLQGEVFRIIKDRIQSKLNKDYGKNVALIVRHSSPLPWNIDLISDNLRESLDLSNNKFDKGIWVIIIFNSENKIFRII